MLLVLEVNVPALQGWHVACSVVAAKVPAEHAIATTNFGSACAFKGTPWINNCGFDSVGSMLQHLHHNVLTPPSTMNASAATGTLLEFDQAKFIPLPYTSDATALQKSALLFIPDTCRKAGGCRLHVALHGCEQTREQIGNAFAQETGYLPWAAANRMCVLFPQVKVTAANPKGCWDWWGYTGIDYACKLGAQIQAIKAMVTQLIGKAVGGRDSHLIGLPS